MSTYFYDYDQLDDLVSEIDGISISSVSMTDLPGVDARFFIDDTYDPQGTLCVTATSNVPLTITDAVTDNTGTVDATIYTARPPHPPRPPKF